MKKQYGENNIKKGGIAEEIAILKQRREARKAREDRKNNPNEIKNPKEADAKFVKMMKQKKQEISKMSPLNFQFSSQSKIFVVVRKRPLSQKEINNGEIDCISVINPKVYIHECKVQVDGISKYLEDHEFYFDNTFGENNTTNDVYKYTIEPMINLILDQGIVTCFAYGQTGSGKTFTMKGIESQAIDALFNMSKKNGNKFDFYISFFEIYGGRLYDLLNNKNKLQVLDDQKGKVQIYGLINQIADSPEEMHHIMDAANAIRTTHNTVTNETSSRSHAICNIVLKLKGDDEEYGKLSLVDLAGSERAQETQSNNRQRRAEGAEINKSLLALKECIRALDEKKNGNPDTHVPFRASKLTHVLRDSFISKSDKSRIIMISCVSPSYANANHSINTLRYSDRLKEQTKQHFGGNYNNINSGARNMNSNNNNNNHNNYNSYNSNLPSNRPITNSNNNRANKAVSSNKNNNNNNNNNKNKNNNNNLPKAFNNIKQLDAMDIDEGNDVGKEDEEDWLYLKKTAKLEGKLLSDEVIKYHKLTDKLVEDEDDIINTHMNIIKEDAKLLNEEGDLITNIKGVGTNDDFTIDEYITGLDKVIEYKIQAYSKLREKVNRYKKHCQEEDALRKKLNPNNFN